MKIQLLLQQFKMVEGVPVWQSNYPNKEMSVEDVPPDAWDDKKAFSVNVLNVANYLMQRNKMSLTIAMSTQVEGTLFTVIQRILIQ